MFAIALIALQFAGSSQPLPPGAILRLGDPHFRADGPIRHLRFSEDGRVLHGWVDGPEGSLRPVAWDSETGVRLPLRDASEAPDLPGNTVPAVRLGRHRVLTAGPGRVGIVWDAGTRKELARLGGHVGEVSAVAASASGRRLATGDTDGLIKLWDAETYVPVPGPRGHLGRVRDVRFSADGGRALTLGDDRTARVWDLATGRELRAFAADSLVDLNAAGTGILVQAGSTTTIRDVVTGLEMIPPDDARRAGTILPARHEQSEPDISPCGRVRARVTTRGQIDLVEIVTDGVRRTIGGAGSAAVVLGFTPDGSRLLTAGADHTILVWDVRLQATPLPEALKRETKAAKLWALMCTGPADEACRAMARLAVEPPAAAKMARLRLEPARTALDESAESRLGDTRAVELLEALRSPEAAEFLEELARGDDGAVLTREAKLALNRLKSRRSPSPGHR